MSWPREDKKRGSKKRLYDFDGKEKRMGDSKSAERQSVNRIWQRNILKVQRYSAPVLRRHVSRRKKGGRTRAESAPRTDKGHSHRPLTGDKAFAAGTNLVVVKERNYTECAYSRELRREKLVGKKKKTDRPTRSLRQTI